MTRIGREVAGFLGVIVTLAGCASLAVNPCDTVADRDGKYFGRFFLGVATLGLTEVTIQQEEIRQAYTGSPGCPAPAGVRVVTASVPNTAGGESVAVGTLVNVTPWTIVLYLNENPDVYGAPPLTFLSPGADMRLAFRPGQYRLVARPSGGAAGDLPRVTWNRQIEIDPRVRGFKLQFNQADFRCDEVPAPLTPGSSASARISGLLRREPVRCWSRWRSCSGGSAIAS